MCKVTISTFELFTKYPDAESTRKYFEERRWGSSVTCPHCEEIERITKRKHGYYRCNKCKKDFTVRTGTIFERSHVPLNKWLYAMYILMTARKGISSVQLSKEIGVTQKTSWFMLQRLREACGNDGTILTGVVEIDEVYIGGKEANRHESKRLNKDRGLAGKIPIVGMREKYGRVKAVKIKHVDAYTINKIVEENIELGSELHTDEHRAYIDVELKYTHSSISHNAGEYSVNGVTTNGIESVWALLKRGIYGVYHSVIEKHLSRYINEFSFRLNDGNAKNHTYVRLASLFKHCIGSRITYKELVN